MAQQLPTSKARQYGNVALWCTIQRFHLYGEWPTTYRNPTQRTLKQSAQTRSYVAAKDAKCSTWPCQCNLLEMHLVYGTNLLLYDHSGRAPEAPLQWNQEISYTFSQALDKACVANFAFLDTYYISLYRYDLTSTVRRMLRHFCLTAHRLPIASTVGQGHQPVAYLASLSLPWQR